MRHTLFISLLLIVAALAVFWQVQDYDYIYLDDPGYVTENIQIHKGLSSESVISAFTNTHMGFGIPLTWLSFMLDFELFGL